MLSPITWMGLVMSTLDVKLQIQMRNCVGYLEGTTSVHRFLTCGTEILLLAVITRRR